MPQAAIQGPPLTIEELLDLPEVKNLKSNKKFHALLLGFCAKGEHNHCAHKVKTIDNMTWVCNCECHGHVAPKQKQPGRNAFFDERNEQILKMWEQGWNQGAIGEKFGITSARVSQILKTMREGVG